MSTEQLTVRVLAVDDNETALGTVEERLGEVSADTGTMFETTRCMTFDDAKQWLLTGGFDLAILDLREDKDGLVPGNDRGIVLFEKTKEWAFVPTVFYTAYASDLDKELRDLRFVRVVPKDNPVGLDTAVKELVASGAVFAARGVADAVRSELRDFMWAQTSASVAVGEAELRSQLFRRSSARLDRSSPVGADGVAASRMYLIPPMSQDLECGAIFQEDNKWWVVATPACDLVLRPNGKPKADFVRLLRAKPLAEANVNVRNVATGGRTPRYFYLAPHGPVPELVVDLQQVRTEPFSWWSQQPAEVIAALDTPYAESLMVRYGHYAARVGVPDLAISGS